MQAQWESFLTGAPVAISHFVITLALLGIGVAAYVAITPHNEIKLIRQGNRAAALSLGGVTVSLALPLSVSMAESLALFEIVLWGLSALIGQLGVFFVLDALLRGLPKRIEQGEIAAATILVATKLAIGIVGAAALTN
jgi:putative membrane protein